MVLKDILAISGEPGLFRFIAQGKNAIIVEHLETGKRSSAYGSAKVSSLEDIAVFTEKDDMPLSKVFDLIWDKHNGGSAIDHKSDNESLKSWLLSILPDYDKDRVYVSDIRKITLWYNLLQKLELLVREEGEKAPEETAAVTETEASLPEDKPARKKKTASAAPGKK